MWTPPPPKEREEKKKGRQGVIDWFLMPFLSKVDLTSETQGIQAMWKTGEENRNKKKQKGKKRPPKNPKHHSNSVEVQRSSGDADVSPQNQNLEGEETATVWWAVTCCRALFCHWKDFASVCLSLLKLTALVSVIKSCVSDAHVKPGKNKRCREQRCAFCCVHFGDLTHWLLFSSLLFFKETLQRGNSNYICWRKMQH